MIDFLERHPEKITDPLIGHIEIVFVTLLISLVAAALLTLAGMKSEIMALLLKNTFSVIYSIPSLALFALLIPVTGLGKTTAIIVLTLYNQYLLLGNFLPGLKEADPKACDAAKGIGMTDMQILVMIRLPLAKKALIAGIRLAVVSTVGIATIAATINAGGLGVLLLDGLRTMNSAKIFWGSILSAGMAILINIALKKVEDLL